jgi:hypothetical protein
MNVAIIGAGIYGCHIGSVLSDFGVDVKIFEKNSDIFSEASGNNQFRLHLGYHYARDYRTRNQSKIGFSKFLDTYKEYTKEIDDNFYVVPKYNSLIDFRTYLAIFSHEGFEFELLKNQSKVNLKNVEGIINVSERVICVDKLKKYFKNKLNDKIILKHAISISEFSEFKSKFDYVIDCTWGKFSPLLNSYYEVTHLAYVKMTSFETHPALTFVDGNLWSLYPTENEGIYTLSSVKHTPLFQSHKYVEVEDFVESLDKTILISNFLKMIGEVEYYYPCFKDKFDYIGDQISVKTKIIGSNDPRDCRVWREDNVIRVFSGKIDTLYIAEDYIMNEIL